MSDISAQIKSHLDLLQVGQMHDRFDLIVNSIMNLNDLLKPGLKITFVTPHEYNLNHSTAMCSNCGKKTIVDTSKNNSDFESKALHDLLGLGAVECQYCGTNLAYYGTPSKPSTKPNNNSAMSLPLPPDIDVVDEDFDVEAFQAWQSLIVPVIKTQLYYQQTGV